jgi:hypothetical protein
MRVVTEIELFKACVRWAKKGENPREALGNALGLIRFRAITAEEFALEVCPTELLSGDEKSAIFTWFVTKTGAMPRGFISDAGSRCVGVTESAEDNKLTWSSTVKCQKAGKIHFVKWEFIDFSYTEDKQYQQDQFNSIQNDNPFRFSLNTEGYILGVFLRTGSFLTQPAYKNENKLILKLKRADGSIAASAENSGIEFGVGLLNGLFDHPCLLSANEIYSLHIDFPPSVLDCSLYKIHPQTHKCKSGLEFKVLEEACSIVRSLQLAKKDTPSNT